MLLHQVVLVAAQRFQLLLEFYYQIRRLHQDGYVTSHRIQAITYLIVLEEQIQWSAVDFGQHPEGQ